MFILTEFNTVSILFRLVLAVILGGIIGFDREKITRSAGFRTYSLVCLGATLAMLIGHHINANVGATYDISRIGAQVISGIGFIGAGAIIKIVSSKTTPPKVPENQIGVEVTILVKKHQNSWDIIKALTKLETVKFAHKEYL